MKTANTQVYVTIRLEADVKEEVKRIAKANYRNASQVIRQAIHQYIEENNV